MLDAVRLAEIFRRPETETEEESPAEIVFSLYKNAMYAAAFAILRDEWAAEDAVMDAVAKICASPEKFKGLPERNRRLLVLRVTENAALDRLRKRKRLAARELPLPENENGEELPAAGDPGAEDAYFAGEESFGRLEEAVKRLTRRERTLIQMKYGEGYANREIARELGMTETAVSTGLGRARAKLKKEMLAEKEKHNEKI